MMRRLLLLSMATLLGGCGVQRPIQEHVTIEFGETDSLLVSVATTYELASRSRAVTQRVQAAREAALADRDDWSARFARVGPDVDQIVFERRKGTLERSIRQARIPIDDLQRVFADLPLTFQVSRWERGRELIIYPGTSSRATREQRESFNRKLEPVSESVARYLTAIHGLYSYLEEQNQRAPFVFAALFAEPAVDGAPVGVTEREEALLESVTRSMSEILDQMDAGEPLQLELVEEVDLIFNPFPAKLTVNVPGDIAALEAFEKTTEREVTVEPIDLLDAASTLQGQWITPDPLALLLQAERTDSDLPAAAEVAAMPRSSMPVVSPGDIENAVRERLRRPSTYRVRWVQ